MAAITYSQLSDANFNLNSLDEFLRYEKVHQVWRMIDGEYRLVDTDYVMSWDLDRRRGVARVIRDGIRSNGFAFGAFEGEKLVGYIYVSKTPFGSKGQYIELALFHISTHYRRLGIGRELFRLACEEARACGAQKLYISSGPTMNTQNAYRKFGCVPAEEINAAAVAREPLDIQLEYRL